MPFLKEQRDTVYPLLFIYQLSSKGGCIMKYTIKGEEKNKGASAPKKKVNYNTTPIRVTKATARTVRAIVNKLNKKPLGRRVTFDDVVSQAISLLQKEHLEGIKRATYSSQDHMELQYREYCRLHGQISKDKFLGLLLQSGLPFIEKVD